MSHDGRAATANEDRGGQRRGVEEDSVNIIEESSCWRMAGWSGLMYIYLRYGTS